MIVRIYGYVFHLLVALFLLGLSIVALSTGMHTLRLDVLPWSGTALTWWLFALGLTGIAITALAVKGILRVVFLVWSVAVLLMMIKGFVFSPHVFDGWADFRLTLLWIAGAGLAALGAWMQFRYRPNKR